jgi:hypothetical protein
MSQTYNKLIDNIIWLVRSLGFSTYKYEKIAICTNGKNGPVECPCYTFQFGGIGQEEIPCLLPRKQSKPRETIKSNMVTSIKIIEDKIGDFIGFSLDGNHRFLLEDFSVAHNSSTIGVITNHLLWDNPKENLKQCLDNGDGKARTRIMQYPHEIESGRTSSISYTPLLLKKETWPDLKQSRLISFCDLCGHEKYLRNTVTGICSAFPDFALICIDRKINPMTKEHIKILTAMNVPYAILLTKIDNMPKETLTENIKETTRNLKKMIFGKKIFLVKSDDECKFPFNYDAQVPVILISNTTGSNILRLMRFLSIIPQKITEFSPFFQVDGIFNVYGHGTVVSGNSGIKISNGDKLLIGPFARRHWRGKPHKIFEKEQAIKFEIDKCFIEVNVRSIHDNYRNSISELPANSRGCLCIRFSPKDMHYRH